jgi:hypothetical protein
VDRRGGVDGFALESTLHGAVIFAAYNRMASNVINSTNRSWWIVHIQPTNQKSR